MDPAELARAATAALAPFLIEAGETVAMEAVKKLPEQARKVWSLIETKIHGKPAAEEAAQDLVENPSDEDNQAAFELQIKKLIKENPEFGEALSIALTRKGPGTASNMGSGAAASGGSVAAGAGGIAIGGSVGGSVVLGNNNTVGESRKGVL